MAGVDPLNALSANVTKSFEQLEDMIKTTARNTQSLSKKLEADFASQSQDDEPAESLEMENSLRDPVRVKKNLQCARNELSDIKAELGSLRQLSADSAAAIQLEFSKLQAAMQTLQQNNLLLHEQVIEGKIRLDQVDTAVTKVQSESAS